MPVSCFQFAVIQPDNTYGCWCGVRSDRPRSQAQTFTSGSDLASTKGGQSVSGLTLFERRPFVTLYWWGYGVARWTGLQSAVWFVRCVATSCGLIGIAYILGVEAAFGMVTVERANTELQ
jgi:hypothetical protein